LLTFYFSKADGRMTTPETLTAGMVGARVKFEFSHEWDNLNKTAVFYAGGIVRDAAMTDNMAVIPYEVLKIPAAQLYVGVYGVSSDGKTVIPTIRARGPVILPGADPSGDPGQDPELPVWVQLQAETEALGEQMDALEDRVDALKGSEGAVSEEQVIGIVEDYLADHGVELPDAPEPGEDDIPKVFFGGPLQQTKTEAVVPFRYISKTQDFSGYAEIKAQGNSSMSYPKKNQTVKLYKDAACTEKLKVDFKGWGKQNKHVYKANWIDLSHARNVVSARLWADVVRSRDNYEDLPQLLRTSPNQGAIDGFPVKVYAAGVYQGRYTLNIPKDKWTFNMDDSQEYQCILCGENYVSGCFRAAANIDGSDWTDELHDTVPTFILQRWNEILYFVMNASDEVFVAELPDHFYLDSLLDYHLFGLASCGLDAYGKNQIYATYDGLKWFASMYDMDSTWGLYWNGSKFVSSSYGRTEYEDMIDGREGNLLYMRLESLFWQELQARWAKLKKGPLSIENIINRFEQFTDIAPAELVKEDYASTTGGGKFTGIPSKTTNHIQQIRAFALERLAWVDAYVAGLTGGSHTHSYTSAVTTAATCTTDGVRTYSCDCGSTYTETIPASGHNYVNGVCTVCGAADPDYILKVPCTGISLNKTALTFTSADSQTLVATAVPADTTDTIVWTSSSSGIAAVENGVVTPRADGSCTITATCGEFSASCAVSVTGVATAVYLYENYSPNGESFMQTVDIDWAAGDRIEAEIDISNCTGGTNYEGLLTIGLDIANWIGDNLHLYYKPSVKELQVDYVHMGSAVTSRRAITVDGDIISCTVTSESVTFNDSVLTKTEAGSNGTNTVAAWLASSTIQVGSMEGTTRSTATYHYVRIVRA